MDNPLGIWMVFQDERVPRMAPGSAADFLSDLEQMEFLICEQKATIFLQPTEAGTLDIFKQSF